jgi:hypothetical protein
MIKFIKKYIIKTLAEYLFWQVKKIKKLFGGRKNINKELSSEFEEKFIKNEFDELYGSKLGNFGKIFFLFLILFLAAGFAIKSMSFLKEKLDDPFVRTLKINGLEKVDMFAVEIVKDSVVSWLNNPDTLNYYRIDKINEFTEDRLITFISDFNELDFIGRSIDFESPLLEKVFDEQNVILGSAYGSCEDKSLVVTIELLQKLRIIEEKYSTNSIPSFIQIIPTGTPHNLFIPIQAVVKKLPRGNDFIMLNKYEDHFFSMGGVEKVFDVYMEDTVTFYVETQFDNAKILEVLNTISIQSEVLDDMDTTNWNVQKMSVCKPLALLKFSGYTDKEQVKTILKQNAALLGTNDKGIEFANFKDYIFSGCKDYFDKTTNTAEISFNKLNRVYDLDIALKRWSAEKIPEIAGGFSNKVVFEFDMESIVLRDIFKIAKGILLLLIVVIGVVSGVAIFTIVKVLFEKYFQKIEKNIGTLMAFGINIKDIFTNILIVFMVLSVFLSYIAAIIIGEIISLIIDAAGWVTSMNISIDLFTLFNWIPFGVILLAIIATLIAYYRAFRIFEHWPGDIIYDRANKA